MGGEWGQLGLRVKKRLIRTIDLVSILAFDAVLLCAGYIAIRLTEAMSGSENKFFDAARVLSGALFLLLYVVVVAYDVLEFIRGQ